MRWKSPKYRDDVSEESVRGECKRQKGDDESRVNGGPGRFPFISLSLSRAHSPALALALAHRSSPKTSTLEQIKGYRMDTHTHTPGSHTIQLSARSP